MRFNNRGQEVGKIITAFPVLILVFLMIAGFIVLSFFASSLFGSGFGASESVLDMSVLTEPIMVKKGELIEEELMINAIYDVWGEVEKKNDCDDINIDFHGTSENGNYDPGCFVVITHYNDDTREDNGFYRTGGYDWLNTCVRILEVNEGGFSSEIDDSERFMRGGVDNKGYGWYVKEYPNELASFVSLDYTDENGEEDYIVFNVRSKECAK